MTSLQQKNKKVLTLTLGVVFGMVALSFASVPLYRLLCQATGWGGTTQNVAKSSPRVYDREIKVQFNADIDPQMPWEFKPDQRQVTVKVGANALISYSAVNRSRLPVAGTSIYNVTPLKVGKYFNKTQCFCFGQQILQPGKKAHFPVTFFIDPKIMDDRNMDDVKTITLSYTFYPLDSAALERAMEAFYNQPDSAKQSPATSN